MLSGSFETIESCSLDSATMANLRATGEFQASWNEATIDDDYEEIIVSDNEEEEDRLGETGILIVAPGQDAHQSSLLTMPDSVPTNVGSIHMSAMQRARSDESASTSSNLQPGGKLKTRLSIGLALAAFVFLCIFPAFYIMHERAELRSATLRLEEEIRLLNQKIEQKAHEEMKQQQQQHQQALPKFDWEQQQQEPNTCSGSPHMLDNCWVHAEANFELGDCARKTKKKVKKGLRKLGKTLWHAQADFLDRMRDFRENYKEAPLFFTPATKNASQDNSSSPQDHVPAIVDQSKEQMEKIGKVAGRVVKGVAIASAAAVVVSAAFLFGGGNDEE